jgi:hypothetical protein
MDRARQSNRKLALGKIDQDVVMPKNARRNIHLYIHARRNHRRGVYGLQWDLRFLQPCKRNRHSGNDHSPWRRRRAFLLPAGDVQAQQGRQPPRQIEIGIPVINPGANCPRRSIGQPHINIDYHAVVINRRRNGHRRGRGGTRWFRLCKAEPGQKEYAPSKRRSHSKIVARLGLCRGGGISLQRTRTVAKFPPV